MRRRRRRWLVPAARSAAAGRRTPVRARFLGLAAAGAAVAAALIVAWTLHVAGPTAPVGGPQPNARSPPRPTSPSPSTFWITGPPGGEAILLLSSDLDQFESELVVTKGPALMDSQFDSVQQDIDNFWSDESSPAAPQI